MKTWDEFQRDRQQTLQPETERLLDVGCPKCGARIYEDLTCFLASYPPQTPVFCKSCDFRSSY